MTIEQYINLRESGETLDDIQEEYVLSEATAWTFEIGYQCFLKKIPLDKAVLTIVRDWKTKEPMYKVVKPLEVVTDYEFHLGLKVGDLLHKISDDKYRLDGTGHTFGVFDSFITRVES